MHRENTTMGMAYEQNIQDQHQILPDDSSIYCKLFADEVPMNICDLRTRELHGRGEFTCAGCNRAAA